jgi:hypothetical protein
MEYTPSFKHRNMGYQKRPQRGGYQKRGGRRGTNSQYQPHSQNRYYQNRTPQSYYQQYPPNQMYSPYYNPVIAQEMVYQTEMYIFTKYRHLLDINVKSSGLSKTLTDSSSFYVIKSFSEEDVHKSIKYNVWSSSKTGNLTLTNSFNLTKEKNGYVYLFFSCNGSGRFVGVARMKTSCDNDKSFEYWTQDQKWMGLFEVEWMFIKDVPFKEFKDIIITMKDGETKPISNSRDVQEIPFDAAKKMMEIFENFQNTNTILEHFKFYDTRQENYMKKMKIMKDVKEQQPIEKEIKEPVKEENNQKE